MTVSVVDVGDVYLYLVSESDLEFNLRRHFHFKVLEKEKKGVTVVLLTYNDNRC